MVKIQKPFSTSLSGFSLMSLAALLVFVSLQFSSGAALAGQDVVFDECHAQTAGNADWTTTGGFSDFADVFKDMGFNVIAAKKEITAATLKNAAIIVLSEPNSVYSNSEKKVISEFVKAGGGLFAIADHKGADRNNDGIDAIGVLNQIIPEFGLSFEVNSINEFPIPINSSDDDMLDGAKTMGTWAGTTVTANSPEAKTLVPSRKQAGRFLMGYCAPKNAKGRIVAFGDSSIFDDGTGAPGNKLYDGFNRKDCSHITLTKNAISFLAKNADLINRSNNIAKNMNIGGEVSKHYDPAHPGHSHQAPDGTMYHQTGDFYPGSPASSNGQTQPHHPSPNYPNHPPAPPSYPSQPTYPSQPQYGQDVALYQQGFKYFGENNFFMAIDSFKRLTRNYKSSQYFEGGMYYLALCYKNTYNYGEAVKTLKTMINDLRHSPNRPSWFFTAGEVCEAGFQFANAAKWYESFLNEHAAHQKAPEALYKAGQAYEKGYTFKDATRAYRRLTASYPYSPFAQMSYERLSALSIYGF